MRIPVIGGLRSGGVPWALAYGRAGLLVDVTSPAAIAQGMRAMMQDAELRGTLARSGRERALKEFRLEEVARKYEQQLENARQEQTR
jgi:glycosyltransferase involved in cell wall biosynthesis